MYKLKRRFLFALILMISLLGTGSSIYSQTINLSGTSPANIKIKISGEVTIDQAISCDFTSFSQTKFFGPDITIKDIPSQSDLETDRLSYMTQASPKINLFVFYGLLSKYNKVLAQSDDITITCDYKGTSPTAPLRLAFSSSADFAGASNDLATKFTTLTGINKAVYESAFSIATVLLMNSQDVYRLDFKNLTNTNRNLEKAITPISNGTTTLRFYYILARLNDADLGGWVPNIPEAPFTAQMPVVVEFY